MKDFWADKWDWLARKQRAFFLEAMKMRFTIYIIANTGTAEIVLCQADSLESINAVLAALWRDDVQGPRQVRIERN